MFVAPCCTAVDALWVVVVVVVVLGVFFVCCSARLSTPLAALATPCRHGKSLRFRPPHTPHIRMFRNIFPARRCLRGACAFRPTWPRRRRHPGVDLRSAESECPRAVRQSNADTRTGAALPLQRHGCGNFDIIMTHHFDPFLSYRSLFTAVHAPWGVLYVDLVIEFWDADWA